jgi:putative membrane protein
VTLGLFLLVINALVILMAAELIPGFAVDGFWWALGFAVVLSIINGIFGNSLDSDR